MSNVYPMLSRLASQNTGNWPVFDTGNLKLSACPIYSKWMELSPMLKQSIIGVSLVGVGFLGGAYYVGKDVEASLAIGLAAQVLQQDRVLTYLESDNADAARRIQAQYLKFSILELNAMNASLPSEVQVVVQRRATL